MNGDYFKDKSEAVEYYKNNTESLKDKPDWLIECVIDFACQFPNYKEYCEVEEKVKQGKELNAKQKKKYGHLKWETKDRAYKKNDVLYDNVDVKQKGEYDDIVNDTPERAKMNKYNLDFGEQLKPDENVTLRLKTPDGEYEATASVEQLNRDAGEEGMVKENWDIKPIENKNVLV